eukprot:3010203-Rhodomonas_salina.2
MRSMSALLLTTSSPTMFQLCGGVFKSQISNTQSVEVDGRRSVPSSSNSALNPGPNARDGGVVSVIEASERLLPVLL